MVTLIIVGVLAWALKEAAEDVIRTVRGDPPPSPRRGFRGYVEDRWNALADRHHRAKESGLISQLDSWAYRRHLAREKALKRAGFATDEAIALAAAEHRRRMALIEQGINPDAEPPAPVASEPIVEPDSSIDDHYDTNAELLDDPENNSGPTINPDPDPTPDTEPAPTLDPARSTQAPTDTTPKAPEGVWDPFAPITDTKETTMSNNGEITGPAAVLQFHDDLKTSLDQAAGIVDILNGLAYELEGRANDAAANITATETAGGGMDGLGMSDAAAAARSLMETQQAIQDALTEAAAIKDRAAVIADQIGASQIHLATIKSAHDAQLTVQEARAGAGRGNLAKDSYLDDND
jgi:hypothetical protein